MAASSAELWSVRTWQSDDGLPNNNATSLAQSPDGYLWIATPPKLARFDGVRFEEYSSQSIVPKLDRKITVLLQSRNGGLWIGTEQGPVLCLKSGKVQAFTNIAPDMVAEAMVEDAGGAVWVLFGGAPEGMLCRFENGTVSPVWTGRGWRSVTADRQGRLWFFNEGRLWMFENGRLDEQTQLPNRTTRLAASSSGGIWIGSGAQLFKLDEKNNLKEFGTNSQLGAGTQLTTLLEDRSGAVWIGTSDSGLFRFSDGQFEKVPASHRQILSLLEDREGNFWVGTGGGGLDRIQPRAIELEGTETGLPFEAVQSVCEDTNGVIWAATQNGLLACRRNGAWSTFTFPPGDPGLTSNLVSCVAADRSGTVWIAAQYQQLISIQNGRIKHWGAKDGILSHRIHSLLVGKSGDLWIGGNVPDCLQCLHDGKLQTFLLPTDIHVIRTMTEDADGNIWAGTAKGKLFRVSAGHVTEQSIAMTGVQWSIRSLHVSADNSLWIGYSGLGLGRIKDGHYSRVGSDKGLCDDQISQIISDGRGWLWLGADHGIFKIRQQEFEDVAAGRAARLHPVHYGQSDGLPSLQANFGAAPGTLHSHDDRLWIPMRTALAAVDLAKLQADPEPPSVVLTRVVADDKVVAVYGGAAPVRNMADLRIPETRLRFPPNHRRLEFDFTALSFAAPESIIFQYRLDGFDENWIEGGAQRNVSYSRLPAGKYQFRVRACNRDGVWNETGAVIPFTVDPFLWQTWWFRLTALIVFTSAIIGIARYVSFRRLRLRLQLVEQQAALYKERARIARDIHDDLGCCLTKIVLLTELTLRKSGEADNPIERVKQISTTAREGMQSLDETVWAINPRNDTLADLIDYIGQFALELLQSAGIRCYIDLPDHPPARTISSDVRHNLFLAVKEALNNIVRHANASEVRLRVAVDGDALSISIRDDGRGFGQMPDNACADGLRNMRQRLEEISGQCRIESKPGTGTEIRFIHPSQNGN